MILTTPCLLHGAWQGRFAFASVPFSGLAGVQKTAEASRIGAKRKRMINEQRPASPFSGLDLSSEVGPQDPKDRKGELAPGR